MSALNNNLEAKYILELKKIVEDFLKTEDVKIFLFGSRARQDHNLFSDVDIGVFPGDESARRKIIFLKERIEESNIPYKVEFVNLKEVSYDFKNEILKDAISWKG